MTFITNWLPTRVQEASDDKKSNKEVALPCKNHHKKGARLAPAGGYFGGKKIFTSGITRESMQSAHFL